jgi:excisionase family DNA binding protein
MLLSTDDRRRTLEPIATSVKDAAKALSLGRTSIYALINEGRLHTIKLGRRTLIKIDSIHALLSECDGAAAQ